MQEKQDYIMMQIEQLGQVLGKILADLLGLRSGNVSGAYEMVAHRFQTELDIDIEQLMNMDEQEFKNYITDCLLKSSKLYFQMADLLLKTAKHQDDNIISLKLYEKALIVYKMEMIETKTFSVSKQKRMSEIEMIIQDLNKQI